MAASHESPHREAAEPCRRQAIRANTPGDTRQPPPTTRDSPAQIPPEAAGSGLPLGPPPNRDCNDSSAFHAALASDNTPRDA